MTNTVTKEFSPMFGSADLKTVRDAVTYMGDYIDAIEHAQNQLEDNFKQLESIVDGEDAVEAIKLFSDNINIENDLLAAAFRAELKRLQKIDARLDDKI